MLEEAPPIKPFGVVYKFTNTVNGKVYIGITSRPISERINDHITLSNSGGGHKFHNATRKYGFDAFVLEILEECFTKEDLQEKEIFYIAKYKADSRRYGYNLTQGGESGFHLAPETKLKLSKKAVGRKVPLEVCQRISETQKGKKHTEETKQKMSRVQKGHKVSEETCLLFSEMNTGRVVSPEVRLKIRNTQKEKPVFISEETFRKRLETRRLNDSKKEKILQQIDKFGNVVAEFTSIAEAARLCGFAAESISKVCRGKAKTCGKFFWRLKNEKVEQLVGSQVGRGTSSKPVIQLDRSYNIISEFSSSKEAADKYGLGGSTISSVCRGKGKTAAGFIWCFKNDIDRLLERKQVSGNRQGREVVQLDYAGNIVGTFPSIAEASRKSGIGYGGISKSCHGDQRTSGGFIWKYKEEVIKND
jgi:group I intron endonuclease